VGCSAGPDSAAATLSLLLLRWGFRRMGCVGALNHRVSKHEKNLGKQIHHKCLFFQSMVPKTLSVMLVSPRLTVSKEALISQRQRPPGSPYAALSWRPQWLLDPQRDLKEISEHHEESFPVCT